MKKIVLFALYSFGLLISCSKDADVSSPESNTNLMAGNRLTTGASARDFLSNDTFDRLLIEIDYVTGFAPTAGAIANFEEFLRARTHKEIIEFTYSEFLSIAPMINSGFSVSTGKTLKSLAPKILKSNIR